MELGRVANIVDIIKPVTEVESLVKEASADNKKMVPNVESYKKVEGYPRIVENSNLGEFVKRSWQQDNENKNATQIEKDKLEQARKNMSMLPRYMALVDRAASGKSTEQLPPIDMAVFQGAREMFNSAVEGLKKLKGNKREIRGDRLPNVSFDQDRNMLDNATASEMAALAHGVELAAGLNEVKSVPEVFDKAQMNKLKKMNVEMRQKAVVAAVMIDRQKSYIDALTTRIIDRRPGSAVEIRNDAERTKNHIDRLSMPRESAAQLIDKKVLGDTLKNYYQEHGITDEKVVASAMEKAGVVFDKDKNEYKVDKNSSYLIYVMAKEQYRLSIREAKNDMSGDAGRALASYIGINRAIEAGNNMMMAEQQMSIIFMESKAQQDRVNWHDKIKNEAAMKKVDAKLAKVKKPGFFEGISKIIGESLSNLGKNLQESRDARINKIQAEKDVLEKKRKELEALKAKN